MELDGWEKFNYLQRKITPFKLFAWGGRGGALGKKAFDVIKAFLPLRQRVEGFNLNS